MSQPEAARLSFELIASLSRDGPDQLVTVDNFPGLVTLLDDFASSAGILTESHQQQGRRSQQPLTTATCVKSNKYIINPPLTFIFLQFTSSRAGQNSH